MNKLIRNTLFLFFAITFCIQNAFSLEQEEKQIYIDKLNEHSLIVYKDKNNITTSNEHNLKPLLNHLEKSDFDDTEEFYATLIDENTLLMQQFYPFDGNIGVSYQTYRRK